MQPADRFRDLLASGRFLLTAQADPVKGADQRGFVQALSFLKDRVDALFLPDNRGARAGICGPAAALIAMEKGLLPVAVVSCRDRNRIALCSDMLGLFSMGVGTLFCVSGDYVSLGDMPDAKPVYDLDSVQLLEAARMLEKGQDLGGNDLHGSAVFCLGCAANPQASPLEPHLIKLEKKARAGAEFVVTLDAFDMERLRSFLAKTGEMGIKAIAGLRLITERDISWLKEGKASSHAVPHQLLQQYAEVGKEDAIKMETARIGRSIADLKASGMCAGVHLNLEGREDLLESILKEAGI
jgi:5,10-methylenetetrahydrofolate reductase